VNDLTSARGSWSRASGSYACPKPQPGIEAAKARTLRPAHSSRLTYLLPPKPVAAPAQGRFTEMNGGMDR
jgi:hypothetical protein